MNTIEYWKARSLLAEEALRVFELDLIERDRALDNLHEVAEHYEEALDQLGAHVVLMHVLLARSL